MRHFIGKVIRSSDSRHKKTVGELKLFFSNCPCSAKMREHGGLAQLGERLHGMQEVVGSIPIVSIQLGKIEIRRKAVFLLLKIRTYVRYNELT